jgi:hypothetical protein
MACKRSLGKPHWLRYIRGHEPPGPTEEEEEEEEYNPFTVNIEPLKSSP